MGSKEISSQWSVVSAVHRGMRLAHRLRSLVMAAACCLVAGGAWATDYYRWSAKNATGNWNDYSNWEYCTDGESWAAATTDQYPNSKDAVVSIPADAGGETLTITGSSSRTGTLTIYRNVTLTGSFTLDTISGSSTLTLNNATLAGGTGFSISTPVVIAGTVDNSSNGTLTLSNSVSGDGKITNSASGGSAWNGFEFDGDASLFEGTYTGGQRKNQGYIRDTTKFSSGAGTSSRATYTVGQSNGASVLGKSGTAEKYETYNFGKITTSNFSFKDISYAELSIGALNNDSTFTADSARLGANNKITKVGSGTLTLSAGVSKLTVENGCVIFSDNYLPNSILMTGTGALTLDDVFTPDYLARVSYASAATPRAFAVPTNGWVKIAEPFAGATGGFTKKDAGTLEFTTTPQWTGETSVEGGLLIVPDGASLTLAEGTGSVDMGDGRILLYNESEAKIWTGGGTIENGGKDANGFYIWTSVENWRNGIVPASDTDVAIIPGTADVTLSITNSQSSAAYTGLLTICRDVSIAGKFYVATINGSGVLTSKNIDAYKDGGAFAINCDLCVDGYFYARSSISFTVRGAISGSGEMKQLDWVSSQPGFQFYGDTSNFAGTYVGGKRSGNSRDQTRFFADATGSALASWEFGADTSSSSVYPFQTNGQSYYRFGTWTSGNFYIQPKTGVTVEVGGRASGNSVLTGTLSDDSNILRKVGPTSTMTLTLNAVKGTLEVEEGTTYLKGSNLPTALKLTGKDAVLYVISTLDASSLVASSLAAYTVTKSEETETISGVEYYKYTLTASATSVATDDSGTVYATIGDAITNAVSGATITITGSATDNATIPDGKVLTITFDGGSYSGRVTADDGGTVLDGSESAITSGTTTYSCKKLYTHVDDLVGSNTLDDGAYYTSADSNFNLPGKAAGAVGTLTITGVGNSLDVRRNMFIGPRDNTTGRINVINDGVLVHTEDTANSSVVLGNKAGAEGTLNIDGGSFTNKTGEIRIGGVTGATGKIIVSAGEFYDAVGKVRVGMAQESTGLVEFTGGTFEIPETANSSNPYIDIAEGQSSHGEVLVGGTASLTIKNLPVGRGASSQGWLTVADNASVSISTSLNAGYSANSYGKVLIEDSASLIVTGSNGVTLGNANSATGIVEVAGGSVSIPDNDSSYYDIGNYSGARGELIVSGGTVSAQYYNVGNKAGAEAAMTVSNGNVTASSHIAVGGNYNGSGTLTGTTATYEQTSGAVTTKDFHVGYCAASTGTATISGGTLTMSGGDLALAKSGSGASATLVIDGGTVTSTKSLLMGGAGTATIDVTIGGGENAAVADFATGVLFARNGSTSNTKEAITLLPNGTLRVDTIKASNDTVAEEAYVLFNGGVLAPHSSKDISSASMLQQDASQKLSFVIGEGGMIVSNDYAAAIDMTGVVAADGVSIPRLIKKGRGVLTLTNVPDALDIAVEAGGVCVTKTTGKTYIGECSMTTDYSVNASSDWVRDGSLSVNGALYVGNAASVTAQLDITNATVSAVRVNLDNGNSTSATLNIWKDGKIVTTGTPGVTQHAHLLNIGWYGNSNTVNVRGGEIDTLATVNLRNNTISNPLNVTEGGVIKAGSLAGYTSSLIATFDNGTLVAKYATNEFVTATVNIGTGGMTISSDYDVTATSSFSGTGGLMKTGSGTLTFTTAPTFTGTITVAENGGSVVVPNTCTVTAGANTVRNDGESDTYVFTYSASSGSLEPGQTDGKTYDTQEAAQTAAAAITQIVIPSAVSSVVTTEAQITAYKALFSAQAVASTTSEGKYVVVVDFKADKKTELESALTQEFADVDFTAVATTGAAVQIAEPIAGLYYGVLYSADPANVTTLYGDRQLSDGSALNLTLPSGEGTVQFYKLQVSTTAE